VSASSPSLRQRFCDAAGEGSGLLLALILTHLVLLWAFPYVPTHDGPAHLENACILADYSRPDLDLLARYYRFNRELGANWFGHLILAGLTRLLPLLVAEKVFLSGYAILLPLSVRYAANAVRPGSGFLGVLVFPFLYGFLFHFGFYYFVYSLPLFFFTLGYWLKHRESFTLGQTASLSLLALALAFTHLYSLVMASLAIGVLACVFTLADLRGRHPPAAPSWPAFRSRVLVTLYAFLPALLVLVVFLLPRHKAWSPASAPPRDRLLSLIRAEAVLSFGAQDPVEGWLARSVFWLLAAAAAFVLGRKLLQRRWERVDGLWLVLLAALALHLLVPDQAASGTRLQERAALYVFLVLILCLATEPFGKRAGLGLQALGAVLALALLGRHAVGYARWNADLEEYLSGRPFIEPNRTLLPIPARPPRGRDPSPLQHAAGYIAAERGVVDLANYQPATGHFPLLFRPALDPTGWVGFVLEGGSADVDIAGYEQATGARVDYVLLWDAPPDGAEAARMLGSVVGRLREGYTLVFTSPPRGRMQLFRRN
jgi:hypothetical protein